MASEKKEEAVGIGDIAEILATSTQLQEHRQQFWQFLKVIDGEMFQDEHGFLNRTVNATDLFSSVLRKWIEKKPDNEPAHTVGDLVQILENKHYNDLKDKLKEKYNDDQQIVNPNLPPLEEKWWPNEKKVVNSFIERMLDGKPVVEKIHAYLTNKNVSATVINQHCSVSGLGGVGKTSLAKWYAIQYADRYDFIIWIDCGERNLRESFNTLAESLKVKQTNANGTLEKIAVVCFKRLLSFKCLFIFDNAECYSGPQGIKDIIPRHCDNFYTLITSRAREWGKEEGYGKIQEYHLGAFTREESIEFLIKNINNLIKNKAPTNEDCDQLAKHLHDFPLALQIAIAYLNSNFMTVCVSEYIKQLEKTKHIIHYNPNLDDYDKTIFETMKVSLDQINTISESGSVANEILAYLGYLAPDNIEIQLFRNLARNSDFLVTAAIEHLYNYSLITDTDRLRISIHRVLQKVLIEVHKDKQIELYRNIFNLQMKTFSKYKIHPYILATKIKGLERECGAVRNELHQFLKLTDLVQEAKYTEAICLAQIKVEYSSTTSLCVNLFNFGIMQFLAKEFKNAKDVFLKIHRKFGNYLPRSDKVSIGIDSSSFPNMETLCTMIVLSMRHLNISDNRYAKILANVSHVFVDSSLQSHLCVHVAHILSIGQISGQTQFQHFRIVLKSTSKDTHAGDTRTNSVISKIKFLRATFVDEKGKTAQPRITDFIPSNINKLSIKFSCDNTTQRFAMEYKKDPLNDSITAFKLSFKECETCTLDKFLNLAGLKELTHFKLVNKDDVTFQMNIENLPAQLEHLEIENIIILSNNCKALFPYNTFKMVNSSKVVLKQLDYFSFKHLSLQEDVLVDVLRHYILNQKYQEAIEVIQPCLKYLENEPTAPFATFLCYHFGIIRFMLKDYNGALSNLKDVLVRIGKNSFHSTDSPYQHSEEAWFRMKLGEVSVTVIQLLISQIIGKQMNIENLPAQLEHLEIENIIVLSKGGKVLFPDNIFKMVNTHVISTQIKNLSITLACAPLEMLTGSSLFASHTESLMQLFIAKYQDVSKANCLLNSLAIFKDVNSLQIVNEGKDTFIIHTDCLPPKLQCLEITNVTVVAKRANTVRRLYSLKVNHWNSEEVLKQLDCFLFKQLSLQKHVLVYILSHWINNQMLNKAIDTIASCLNYVEERHTYLDNTITDEWLFSTYLRFNSGLLYYLSKHYCTALGIFMVVQRRMELKKYQFLNFIDQASNDVWFKIELNAISLNGLRFLISHIRHLQGYKFDDSNFNNENFKIIFDEPLSRMEINLKFIPASIRNLEIIGWSHSFKQLRSSSRVPGFKFHLLKTLSLKNITILCDSGQVLKIIQFNEILHSLQNLNELNVSLTEKELSGQIIDFASLPVSLSKLKITKYSVQLSKDHITPSFLNSKAMFQRPYLYSKLSKIEFIRTSFIDKSGKSTQLKITHFISKDVTGMCITFTYYNLTKFTCRFEIEYEIRSSRHTYAVAILFKDCGLEVGDFLKSLTDLNKLRALKLENKGLDKFRINVDCFPPSLKCLKISNVTILSN